MQYLIAILQPLFGALFHELFAMWKEPDSGGIGKSNAGSLSGWVPSQQGETHNPVERQRGDFVGEW